jgi:hypothetical protein
MNICERLVVLAEGSRIEVDDLPASLSTPACGNPSEGGRWREGQSLQQIMESVEREVLAKARMRFGKQAAIAEGLLINQSTVAANFANRACRYPTNRRLGLLGSLICSFAYTDRRPPEKHQNFSHNRPFFQF